eukprot:c10681_g1_i1.p1 GENE.c10681_g1_i1~~c10681_g1_i1.p1  ORF type:complete len:255 (-),score=67.67 c10681_g1_i1:262-990(-)
MSIVWLSIFLVLALEVVVVLFLLLPLPSNFKRAVITTCSESFVTSSLKNIRGFFYILCFLLLVESVRQLQKHPHEDKTAFSVVEKFRAQRNVYITFFTLFFVFVIERTAILVVGHARAERLLEVISKQADQNEKESKRVTDENKSLKEKIAQQENKATESAKLTKKSTDAVKEAEKNQSSFVQLIEEMTRAAERNKQLETESKTKSAKISSLEAEVVALKDKLADFDLLLGSTPKTKGKKEN